MERQLDPGTDPRSARLIGAVWEELSPQEQEAALGLVRELGPRALREHLGVPVAATAGSAPRRRLQIRSPRGRYDHNDPAHRLFHLALVATGEDRYVDAAVERFCPERADLWWARTPEERRADPRVCTFCAAYERERCAILRLPMPPDGLANLQLYLWNLKEQEREAARQWLHTLQVSYSTPEYAETQRALARRKYEGCQRVTDLAQMLLTAATYRAP